MKINKLLQNCEQELFALGVEVQGLKNLVKQAFEEGYTSGCSNSRIDGLNKSDAWNTSEVKKLLEEYINDEEY